MSLSQQQYPSVFAQMVDKLKNKTEEELKMLYLKFFSKDLKEEWKEVTGKSSLKNVSEETIIKAIQSSRYGRK